MGYVSARRGLDVHHARSSRGGVSVRSSACASRFLIARHSASTAASIQDGETDPQAAVDARISAFWTPVDNGDGTLTIPTGLAVDNGDGTLTIGA